MVHKLPVTSKSAALYVVWCYVLLNFWQCHTINGAVTVSPFPRGTVCHIGDQLIVTCRGTVNEAILNWEFVSTLEENNRIVRSITSTQQVQEIVPSHSTVFIFSRISELGKLPLVSTLDITSIQLPLNRSTITCMDSTSNAMATTTVHIVGENDAFHPSKPEVSFEEQFGLDSVTVFLQWTEELNNSLVTYHVSVEPMAHINTGNGRANLTLLYNTPYKLSVVADFCDRRNATTTLLKNYVSCGAPLDELAGSVLVMGYEGVALEGNSVSFTCSSGLVLTGPNSSTCMGNGEWEPDSREVACKGDTESSESNTVNIIVGVVAGAAVIMIITTVIVVVIACRGSIKGYLYGWKQRNIKKDVRENNSSQENQANSSQSGHSQSGLVYADIGPSSIKKPNISSTLQIDDNRVEYARLNHNLNMPVTTNEPISIDLDTLLIQLRPQVGPKWYQFGEAAGIEKEVLDKYASDCAPEECIVEVLDYWLRNCTTRPTWKGIARILKAINLQKLAFDIERVYSTGKLPIEVNTDEVPHGLISESILPPPLPPKLSENDAPPIPPKMIEMINEDQIPPLPPKINESSFITSQPTSGGVSSRVPARPPKP